MTTLSKILFVSDPFTITRKDGTTAQKQTITLQELGGKFANQFAATWISDIPISLPEGTPVAAALRFAVRNFEGQDYQDIFLQDIIPLSLPNAAPLVPELPVVPTIKH